MTRDDTIVIAADHPALPGHFPGNPLVPGALLLDHAAAIAAARSGHRIRGVRSAKFLRPLHAEESCRLAILPQTDGSLKLTCSVGGAPVLTAVIELDEEASQP